MSGGASAPPALAAETIPDPRVIASTLFWSMAYQIVADEVSTELAAASKSASSLVVASVVSSAMVRPL